MTVAFAWFWRWSTLLFAGSLATLSLFLFVAGFNESQISGSLLNIVDVIPFALGGVWITYLLIGFLYNRLFVLVTSEFSDDERWYERLLFAYLIILWPLLVISEILAERMIVTSDGMSSRILQFFLGSLLTRVTLILAVGVAALWGCNHIFLAGQ